MSQTIHNSKRDRGQASTEPPPGEGEKPMLLLSQTHLQKAWVEKLAAHGIRELGHFLSYGRNPEGLLGLSRFLDVEPGDMARLLEKLRLEYAPEAKAAEHPAPNHKPAFGLIPHED
jgi:hypothetical protein